MPVGMIDPTQMTNFAFEATAASKPETADPTAFEKEFHRALAPPGDDPPPPPEERKLDGPEESPTETPNAKSSQMDPQPQVHPLMLLGGMEPPVGSSQPLSDAPALTPASASMPLVAGTPLEQLGVESVETMIPLPEPPADLLEKTPNVAAGLAELPVDLEVETEAPEDEAPPELGPQSRSSHFEAKDGQLQKAPAQIEGPAPINHRAKMLDHLDMIAAKSAKIEVKIEMNPLDLGPMTLEVSQDGKEIKAHAIVENPALRLALDRSQAHLTAALSEAGMNLTDFSMESGPQQEQPGHQLAGFVPKSLTQGPTQSRQTSGSGLEIWI